MKDHLDPSPLTRHCGQRGTIDNSATSSGQHATAGGILGSVDRTGKEATENLFLLLFKFYWKSFYISDHTETALPDITIMVDCVLNTKLLSY